MADHPDASPAPERWPEIERVLDLLLDADPARWPQLIDEHCRGDPALRGEVQALLRQHAASTDFLYVPAAGRIPDALAGQDAEAGDDLPGVEGRRIGAYRILAALDSPGIARLLDGGRESRTPRHRRRPAGRLRPRRHAAPSRARHRVHDRRRAGPPVRRDAASACRASP